MISFIVLSAVVALFTRAWIEIILQPFFILIRIVALFTRAWIEIYHQKIKYEYHHSRPLHEGVD